jgi:tRNA(Ile)-lysidine synthase
LSGGPDSVALLDVLASLRAKTPFTLVAAHLDHRLREDSRDDVAFCRSLCDTLGIELVVGTAPVLERAASDHGGIEEAARKERYAFLRRVKEDRGARRIVVAHTRDDQAETFLLRLLRGSGVTGLGAMRQHAGDLSRPFLEVSRDEIMSHLEEERLPFREDPTNLDPRFARNRIRHEVLPYLALHFNPRVSEGLARTASLVAEEDAYLAAEAKRRLGVCTGDSKGVSLLRTSLQGVEPALARRMIRAGLEKAGGLRGLGAAHVEKILGLARSKAPSGRRIPLPGKREAVFSFESVVFSAQRTNPSPFLIPLPVPGSVIAPSGLSFSAATDDGPPVSKPWEAVVAMGEGGGLVVRSPKPGDRVRIGGRTRRLRRVFMDRKMPRDLRDSYPVVASGEDVLFVPGETLDGLSRGRGPLVRIAVSP